MDQRQGRRHRQGRRRTARRHNNLTKQTALSEKGDVINGRGDTPNRHDILTGSTAGRHGLHRRDKDMTCKNWTSSTDGSAMLGHADRMGLSDDAAVAFLELVASVAGGCTQDGLQADRRRRSAVLLRDHLDDFADAARRRLSGPPSPRGRPCVRLMAANRLANC